jgi:hypothetical protein
VVGNVTIPKVPLFGSTMDVNIPFKIDNATAQVMEADSTNPKYVDPLSSNAPGNFKGSSFFLSILDASGNEVTIIFLRIF